MRRVVHLVVVVALLAGWQAALLHPLEHVDSHGHLVHLVDNGHEHDDERSPDPMAKLCDALSALTACLPDAQVAIIALDFSAESAFLETRAARPGDPPPFLAQGPPAFL